ncbi:RNA polymerase sigma factor [Limibaculum sp. FT325]|uniref:RNA polymerase sigma factor n=1 Tax=Thermohalobaculum sediminis TaxID=2939436 RepID=UPI0020BFD38B|nr:RNA polymerase sigma factor [Limibaculum sediminis]MCL5776108.1 RNA polymerase sigma factor [Limibaculum sediminis]
MRRDRALAALRGELLAYAQSLTLDATAAEDLVQDAMLRALQSPHVPAARSELRPWAFRVVKNLFLDDLRKLRVRMEYRREQARLSRESPPRPADAVEALVVRQAFEKLNPREREILCLIDVLGLSYAEAAMVIGVPPGTVMSRVSRARRSMAEKLGESNIRPLRRRE